MVCSLEWEIYVHECCDGLDWVTVLCMIKEVASAALILGVPFEDIKMRVVGPLCAAGSLRGAGSWESGMLETLFDTIA